MPLPMPALSLSEVLRERSPVVPEFESPVVTEIEPPFSTEPPFWLPAKSTMSDPAPLKLLPTVRLMAPAFPAEATPVASVVLPVVPLLTSFKPELNTRLPVSAPVAPVVAAPVVTVTAPEPRAVGPAATPLLMVTLPLLPEREVPEAKERAPPGVVVPVLASVDPATMFTSDPAPLALVPTARERAPALPHAAAPVARNMSPDRPFLELIAPVLSVSFPVVESSGPLEAPVLISMEPVPGLLPPVVAVLMRMAPDVPELE